MPKSLASAVLLLFCLIGPAKAQTDTSSLAGLVTDATGGTVSGANVTLKNKATSSSRQIATGADGRYQFNLVAPGSYELSVEANGFKKFITENVQLRVADEGTLNVKLDLGSVTESVEVQETVSMLNAESVSQGTVISQEKIVSLPLNGRQFIQLALLVPGASSGGRLVRCNPPRQSGSSISWFSSISMRSKRRHQIGFSSRR